MCRYQMGILVSCVKSYNDSFEGVRVVQLNGVVEEFDNPVKVKHLTDQHPKHFVCRSRSLQSVNTRPLYAEEQLRLGELYFLLPYSALEGDLTPANLVSLASRLIAAAKKANAAKSCSTPHGGKLTDLVISSLFRTETQGTANNGAVSQADFRRMLVNARLPLPAADYPAGCQNLVTGNGDTGDCPELQTAYRDYAVSRSKVWRPRLDTIEEGCFAY